MKKKISVMLLLLPSAVLLFAQTQTGYVRTVGRPDNKAGERLSGVEIRVSGLHGAVISEEDGVFDFNLQGGKESYQLTGVWLDNYELNEKEVIGRTFGVTKVPQEIVMVSLAEKNKIRRKVEEQIQTRYQAKYDELEEKLHSKQIEAEDYQKQIQELQSVFEKREQLVSDMVERYSHTDYAVLKPIEAEINAFVEQGELEKADSVINTLNISKLESDRTTLIERIEKTERKLKRERISKEHIDSTLLIAYQGKIDIFKAGFQNDSAAVYYEKMVAIDTTDISHLLDCGSFIRVYLADYDKALIYFECAMRQSVSKHDENHPDMAEIYNYLGSCHLSMGDYGKASSCYQKALNISLNLFGENSAEVALIYNNIGAFYDEIGEYDKALESYRRALDIRLVIFGDSHSAVASSYNNLSAVFYHKGDYENAQEYCLKSLQVQLNSSNKDEILLAATYNNIGMAYDKLGDYVKALEYHEKALNLRLQIFGCNHPDVAISSSNIGTVYAFLGDDDKALEYYYDALDILVKFYGENHPDVALTYTNIGLTFLEQRNYEEALKLYEKALAINLHTFGEYHPSVAISYNNIGGLYASLRNFKKAIEYHKTALNINLKIYGENHPSTATSYNNIGIDYDELGDHSKALDYHNHALSIRLAVYGGTHRDVAVSYNNLSGCYRDSGNYLKALECCQKALDINLVILGKKHKSVANSYNNLGYIYTDMGDYLKASECFQKSIDIYALTCDINAPQMTFGRLGVYNSLYAYSQEAAADYMKDKLFIMSLVPNYPAAQRGYSGVIYILELGGWSIDGSGNITKYNDALKGKAKTLVFMQDGVICKEYFENSIGGQFGLKQVTSEERQKVIKQYNKWKIHNK